MSEASEDKTKRKFITLLKSYPWECKLNLYFGSQEFGNNIYEYLRRINSSLASKNATIGFVYRVCINTVPKDLLTEYQGLDYEERRKKNKGRNDNLLLSKDSLRA